MKKTLLFSVALAGLMLGSCSSSDDLNGGANNTGFNENGDGYVAVAINLPTQTLELHVPMMISKMALLKSMK